jgi:hypothetical protein
VLGVRHPLPLAGCGEPTQQAGHRGALVDEDAYIALGRGEAQRLGQGGQRATLVTAGGQGQGLERPDLDDAAHPCLRGRQVVQPPQKSERLLGCLPGEQDPGQDQVLGLPGIAGLVVRVQATLVRPAGGRRDIALGQQQPRPLRRDGVEQGGHVRARRDPPGLFHRLQGASMVARGLPDPGQGRQAGGQWWGVDEPPAQRDALGDVLQGGGKLAPLVGDLGHAHMSDARGGQGRRARHCSHLQHLPVDLNCRVQATLGALQQRKMVAASRCQGDLPGRSPLGDARSKGPLGRCEPAAQPLGHGQTHAGDGAQHPLALVEFGQGPRNQRDRAIGVAAELGEIPTLERDRRGDVGHQARGPADRRLIRLIGSSSRQRPLGGIQQAIDRLHTTAEAGQDRLRQQQPWPAADQLGRQGRQPPLQGRCLAVQEEPIHVPLDQPRRPDGIPRSQRVPHRVIGQPVPLAPPGRVAVQRRHPPRLLLLQAGVQQVGEQVVVAPPATHLVQRYQKQVGPLHPLQHVLAVGPPGDRVAQFPRQPLQHRRLQ